jgi:hypothetical protein
MLSISFLLYKNHSNKIQALVKSVNTAANNKEKSTWGGSTQSQKFPKIYN